MKKSSDSNAILRMTSGVVAYHHTAVLSLPAFELSTGTVAILEGANGSGKTSLFRAIAGIGPRFTGTLTYLGRDLRDVSAARRARLGLRLVPQGRHVFSRLSVKQHLDLAAACLQRHSVAQGTQVDSDRSLNPTLLGGQLSGGESKLLIFRALTVGPLKLVLLDEPFAGMEAAAIDLLLHAIRESLRHGASCIVADHTGIAKQQLFSARNYCLARSEEALAPFELRESLV